MARAARHYPDKREFRAVWWDLDSETRARVTHAAMRGQALEDPADAGLAAGFARHHPSRGRMMVALLALGAAFIVGSLAALPSSEDPGSRLVLALLLLVLTAVNLLRFLRLRRAERLNAEVVARRINREEEGSPTTPS